MRRVPHDEWIDPAQNVLSRDDEAIRSALIAAFNLAALLRASEERLSGRDAALRDEWERQITTALRMVAPEFLRKVNE